MDQVIHCFVVLLFRLFTASLPHCFGVSFSHYCSVLLFWVNVPHYCSEFHVSAVIPCCYYGKFIFCKINVF